MLSSVQDYARAYLELHEIQADFMLTTGPLDTFPGILQEREINLVLMGSYSGSAWQEVIVGSVVNFLLREAKCPILICR